MTQLAAATPGAAQWSEQQYLDIFDSAASARHAWVCDERGALAGFVVAREIHGEWELENIAIRVAAQRAGRGARLLAALVEQARIAGASRLQLEVRESNLAARRFYEKCGFQMEGRRRGYYSQPVEDAILYRRALPVAPPAVQS